MILRQLKSYLIGRDPLATDLLLDQMIRLDRHGRTGQFTTGVSSVNCALWDLKGKVLGQPVYGLLGGPTRQASIGIKAIRRRSGSFVWSGGREGRDCPEPCNGCIRP